MPRSHGPLSAPHIVPNPSVRGVKAPICMHSPTHEAIQHPRPLAKPARISFHHTMGKLALLHKADSIYDDEPDVVYDFPKAYLMAIQAAIGDWIVYCEPVKAGPREYFAVARIAQVIPKHGVEGRYLALIEAGGFLPFDRSVPRLHKGQAVESAFAAPDGSLKQGGLVQLAVRRLPKLEVM